MKLTKKQINIIRENTDPTLKGQHKSIWTTLGYFTPAGANWSYIAGYTVDHELVVTRFGEVM